MVKKRDPTLSLIRLIATSLIIFCHTAQWIGFTLGQSELLGRIGDYANVCVPIFLLLSGFLYGMRTNLFQNESRLKFLLRNSKKVLIDYYIYLIFVIIPVYYCLHRDLLTPSKIFQLFTFSNVIFGIHHTWFIPYIIFCYLITPYLFEIKNKILRTNNKFALSLKFCLLLILVEIFSLAFRSYFTAVWINAYIIGFFLPNIYAYISSSSKTRKVIFFSTFTLIVIISTLYRHHVSYTVLPTVARESARYGYYDKFIDYNRVVMAIFIFTVIYVFGKYYLNKNHLSTKLLLYSDILSYDIYLTHMIYVKGELSMLSLTENYLINVILMITATIISAVILHTVSSQLTKIFVNNKHSKLL